MSLKRYFVVLISLAMLVAACSQAKPTPLFLPTRTPPPPAPSATSTAIVAAVATVPPADAPTPSPTETDPAQASATEPAPPSPTPRQSPEQSGVQDQVFPPSVALEAALGGLQTPVYLTYAGEDLPWTFRLFIVEKAGRILWAENGELQPVPFLDITDRVGANGSEQGLLSVAFPPDFDTSEVFYVNYTDQRGDTIIARYRLLAKDPPQGDLSSEQKILQIAQPASNHNGGQLQFGPDGYLYIGTGDGGRAGDPWGNAQNPNEFLGKMLRIDVAGGETYTVPDDNPFVGWSNVRPEIWALGLRNPWRFSFDRATGDLYVADVGQNNYEEVSFQPRSSVGGENYGWDFMEASFCFEPSSGCDPAGLILPVTEYDHSLGCSITGGYVYRGVRYPQLAGLYFFGDFCSGRIWGMRQQASGEWSTTVLLETNARISSFGQDAAGELYVLDYAGGVIYRLTALP